MEPIRTLIVRARLPEPLTPLADLALNLRWTWDASTADLFRELDPHGWEYGRRDGVRVLGALPPERLEALSSDDGFLARLREVHENLRRALDEGGWFAEREGSPLRSVAYFSPEFGLAEAIPQYSGGLGVLAGDHLKAANDLGIPLVGVGLLYHHGYFRQELDVGGWQHERYPTLDPYGMALSPLEGVRVRVDLGDDRLEAAVWRADVGRVPLLLLDANVGENPPEVRDTTDRLYGGEAEHRIRQEILLGIGGVRALAASRTDAQLFHTNEGHAAFLALERIRSAVRDQGLDFASAIEAVRAGIVFTTHTSVPAGIDRFPRELMHRYFASWAEDVGITFDDFMRLGAEPGDEAGETFNMAAMAFRLSGTANGVSVLHGDVSRRLFGPLWADTPIDEVPIGAVTNGVHARSWVSQEMDGLLTRHVGDDWPTAPPQRWEAIWDLSDEDLWDARSRMRARLVDLVRARVREAAPAKGLTEWDLAWTEELLDPAVLTIGFARRFAAYKRATLLLTDPDELRSMLLDAQRPVQIVFAGKAHPADDLGKDMIRQLVAFAHALDVRHRIVFCEDYDIGVGRMLTQGCDVWLNTPRRPHEACGTSGMKAVLNGGLNCSVLDGWWNEFFDGHNGWTVPSVEGYDDLSFRDAVEAAGLYDLLRRRVVPLFYERDERGLPASWLRRVRASLRSIGPHVSASRMVRDYVAHLYEPAAARSERLAGEGNARARALAAWKERVRRAWPDVTVAVGPEPDAVVDLGAKREVSCQVGLGFLTLRDVEVQLVHGPVGVDGRLASVATVGMEPVDPGGPSDRHVYRASFGAETAGRYGYTVRVLPSHPDLAAPTELGLIAWA